ncbi:MAG: hypothetical protein ACLP53_29945 [Isosphaeraceae bacterium]
MRIFNAGKVRYLVVGEYAVMKCTEPRYTKDLDLWIDATPKNAQAVFKGLKEFGVPLANLTEAEHTPRSSNWEPSLWSPSNHSGGPRPMQPAGSPG